MCGFKGLDTCGSGVGFRNVVMIEFTLLWVDIFFVRT